MQPLFVLVIATALSMAIIPVAWRFAPQLGMIDKPDARKVHREAVPRTGGWGIVLGALVPIVMLLDLDPLIQSYVIASLILFLFGMWDDSRQITPYAKFFGQFTAVGVVIYYGGLWIEHAPFMNLQSLSFMMGSALTFFAMVGMINAINTSDGLDGLAGGESLLSLVAMSFLAYAAADGTVLVVASAVIGGVLGFLRYNTHPARVFMGDTGSQFLGFTLAFLAVVLTQRTNTAISPATTLLFLGLPIIDIFSVMIERAIKRVSPFKAARNHIHHRLLDRGFDHYETVIIIYAIQAALVISAIFLRYESDALIVGIYLAVAFGVLGLLTCAERYGWRAHGHGERSALTAFIEQLRNRRILAQSSYWTVVLAVPVYYLYGVVSIADVPYDFAVVSTGLGILAVANLFGGAHAAGLLIRLTTYVAAIFCVYLTSNAAGSGYFDIAVFGMLSLAIALSVRFDSRHKFRTTPMDYLIVFGAVAVAIFGERFLETRELSLLIVKTMILLYGCELVIDRSVRHVNVHSLSTALFLAALAGKGFF